MQTIGEMRDYDRLQAVAEDWELDLLEQLAKRAGIVWQCTCSWANRDRLTCERCGNRALTFSAEQTNALMELFNDEDSWPEQSDPSYGAVELFAGCLSDDGHEARYPTVIALSEEQWRVVFTHLSRLALSGADDQGDDELAATLVAIHEANPAREYED